MKIKTLCFLGEGFKVDKSILSVRLRLRVEYLFVGLSFASTSILPIFRFVCFLFCGIAEAQAVAIAVAVLISDPNLSSNDSAKMYLLKLNKKEAHSHNCLKIYPLKYRFDLYSVLQQFALHALRLH